MNILVLCTGNSARSILLEAILNRLGAAHGISAWSAGSKPTGKVHPQSIKQLHSLGYPTEGLRSKSWDEFASVGATKMDMVITVCGSAAAETCPFWPGAPLRTHWGVEDPAAASESEWPRAFEAAYAKLFSRAEAFLALTPAQQRDTAELLRIGSM